MASGRIAGSGGGTEDQSYFSIGGFAKAGIFSKILPGKLVNKQCATNTSKHDRALGSKSTWKTRNESCVGSHHPGPLHCEGLVPQIFYISRNCRCIWQPILPLKKMWNLGWVTLWLPERIHKWIFQSHVLRYWLFCHPSFCLQICLFCVLQTQSVVHESTHDFMECEDQCEIQILSSWWKNVPWKASSAII